MKKILSFYFRGEKYLVNELGHINANGIGKFSETWVFLGGSKHHFSNTIRPSLKEVFEQPDKLNGCLGWDKDNGTIRQWGGQFAGKLPRISSATVIEATE